jgi:UDPglucose--hexose-1-phosphate uridylyltransferase
MSVLRRDPITGRWVVFADAPPPALAADGPCPFCAGNEHLTPPEIATWPRRESGRDGPGWSVRVVPNARPLLKIEAPLERHADRIYDTTSGTGAHEIVIETPAHRRSLAELPPEQVALALGAWAARMEDLKRDRRFRAIFVFKNQGVLAGAGVPGHAHSQIIGLPVTPKALKELLRGAREHYELKERCVFCDILREELEAGVRVVQETERFVAIAPYASRHPYECWILPREHRADFEAIESGERDDLAALLPALLGRLERALPEPDYNLFLYSGPNRQARPAKWSTLDADFHWHIQILPRLLHETGFELGSGFFANTVTPEQASAALRLGP